MIEISLRNGILNKSMATAFFFLLLMVSSACPVEGWNDPMQDYVKESSSNVSDSLEINSLAAYLRFYSSRAEAHASFLVASLFGMFSFLAIVWHTDIVFGRWNILFLIISIIIYMTLAGVAVHCLYNFRYYANLAEQILEEIEREYTHTEDIFLENLNKTLAQYRDEQQAALGRGIFSLLPFLSPLEQHAILIAGFLVFVLPFLLVFLFKIFRRSCRLS